MNDVEENLKPQFECLFSESGCSLIESMIESVNKRVTKFWTDFLDDDECGHFSDAESSSGDTTDTESDFSSSSQ